MKLAHTRWANCIGRAKYAVEERIARRHRGTGSTELRWSGIIDIAAAGAANVARKGKGMEPNPYLGGSSDQEKGRRRQGGKSWAQTAATKGWNGWGNLRCEVPTLAFG